MLKRVDSVGSGLSMVEWGWGVYIYYTYSVINIYIYIYAYDTRTYIYTHMYIDVYTLSNMFFKLMCIYI